MKGNLAGIFGSFFGGIAGGVLTLTGNVVVASAVNSGISTFFAESFESITGGEKRSTLTIFTDSLLDAGLAALFSKGFDKLTGIAGKKLSKLPFLKRLSGRGSYDASFKMVLTKLKNKQIKNFTIKTFRNGVFSGLWDSTFENIFSGVLNGSGIKDYINRLWNSGFNSVVLSDN